MTKNDQTMRHWWWNSDNWRKVSNDETLNVKAWMTINSSVSGDDNVSGSVMWRTVVMTLLTDLWYCYWWRMIGIVNWIVNDPLLLINWHCGRKIDPGCWLSEGERLLKAMTIIVVDDGNWPNWWWRRWHWYWLKVLLLVIVICCYWILLIVDGQLTESDVGGIVDGDVVDYCWACWLLIIIVIVVIGIVVVIVVGIDDWRIVDPIVDGDGGNC